MKKLIASLLTVGVMASLSALALHSGQELTRGDDNTVRCCAEVSDDEVVTR